LLLLDQIQSFHVRNLVWLLLSEGPLNPDIEDFRLFPQELLTEMYRENEALLLNLDSSNELDNYIAQLKTKRLGIYAEHLLFFFLDRVPTIDLISHGQQLVRDKVTIGELDFVIRYKEKVYHIELAIKYFLGFENVDHFDNWIGPSGNDRLSLKLDKTLNHQLPLMQEDEMKEIYASEAIESYFLLKGRFFKRLQQKTPNWLNPLAIRGSYKFINEIVHNPDFLERKYMVLQRPDWMASLEIDFDNEKAQFLTIENILNYMEADGAVLLKSLKNEAIFVVQHHIVFQNTTA
jgi:hypothetical protein